MNVFKKSLSIFAALALSTSFVQAQELDLLKANQVLNEIASEVVQGSRLVEGLEFSFDPTQTDFAKGTLGASAIASLVKTPWSSAAGQKMAVAVALQTESTNDPELSKAALQASLGLKTDTLGFIKKMAELSLKQDDVPVEMQAILKDLEAAQNLEEVSVAIQAAIDQARASGENLPVSMELARASNNEVTAIRVRIDGGDIDGFGTLSALVQIDASDVKGTLRVSNIMAPTETLKMAFDFIRSYLLQIQAENAELIEKTREFLAGYLQLVEDFLEDVAGA